ncbi:MAG: cereblon family protein [Spirochaetes bacterium]|nr:cereblon family protein [Spirochaetota bacterium]
MDNFYSLRLPVLFFKLSDQYKQYLDPKELEEIDDGSGGDDNWIVCSICQNKLTKNKEKIEINGSHHHQCTNPHGLSFHIRCFQKVQHIKNMGNPSANFSWFSGYKWTIVICHQCHVHLGWKFQSDSHHFYGLINDRLIEENDNR